jgi:quinol monooxygenase YgiN
MKGTPVTLINVFTVAPENQKKLLDLLAQATVSAVRDSPGFISAIMHRSLDGTRVAMYAQWSSTEAYEAMRDRSVPERYLEQALAIAKFEPGTYEVVQTFRPQTRPDHEPPDD